MSRDLSQTNEQQSHFNEWPVSCIGEVDSIQTSLKLLFTPTTKMECLLCLSALEEEKSLTCKKMYMPALSAL
jgi:hypothetical protein